LALAANILENDGLRAVDGGFELDIHLNWYRSLPLSSLKTLELTVNGELVAREEITFLVNGNEYALDELQEHWDEMWFVLDPATLRVRRPLVRPGVGAEVSLRLGNRIPYILVGANTAFESISDRTQVLVAR
jgi:Domain of unknown function (DUF6379)